MTDLEHWINTQRQRRWPIGRREEVGQRRDDAERGLLPDLMQGVEEQVQGAARDDLGRFDRWVGTKSGLVNVTAKIWIQHEREHTSLSHRNVLDEPRFFDLDS